MPALTKEEILGLSDIQVKLIKVPPWDENNNGTPVEAEVYIRTITGAERDKLEDLAFKKQFDNYRARCVAFFLSDDEGNPLFTTADVPKIAKKNAEALDLITDAGIKFNHMRQEDVDSAEGN